MNKIIAFLTCSIMTLLALCSCSRNAAENEYEVIAVRHSRTEKWIVVDTLFGDDIIYTEQKAVNYASSRIPGKFVDISEEFCVYTKYYVGKKETHSSYKLWFTAIDGNERWYKYEKFKYFKLL